MRRREVTHRGDPDAGRMGALVLQLVMSGLLAVAGLFVAMGTEGDMRFFGWVLAGLGVLGVAAGAAVVRRRG